MAFIEDTLCIVWHLNCIKNTCSTVLHVVCIYCIHVIKLSLGTFICTCITMMIYDTVYVYYYNVMYYMYTYHIHISHT